MNTTPSPPPLPAWAEAVRRKYLGGEASIFILHGNVFDEVLLGDHSMPLVDFVAQVLLGPNKSTVASFDAAAGLVFVRGQALEAEPSAASAGEDPLRRAERELLMHDNMGLVIGYAGAVFPAGDDTMLSPQDRANIVRVHRWSMNATLSRKDSVVFLLTETLAELNQRLVGNPRIAAVEVPLPDLPTRQRAVQLADPKMSAADAQRLAMHSSGLKAVHIQRILSPRQDDDLDDREREQLILGLLGTTTHAAERAAKFAGLTRGMNEAEIRKLVNPDQPAGDAPLPDPLAEVVELIRQRKREIIAKECDGLIEFVDAKHGLEAVGGNAGIKQELTRVAAALKSGDRRLAPMGLLFVGAMGTGKTFVAKAFVKTSGLSAVMLKNFRSKWVGSTESNLEKVLGMVKALGPIALIIDEGDRSFGNQSEDSDGGTSSRVIARIKEFMSDTENRGQVLFILMTNRPDKLDIDIKRPGRLDIKIPFFYAQDAQEVGEILLALLKRHGAHYDACEIGQSAVPGRLVGYSNADIEAVVLLAINLASSADGSATINSAVLERAHEDFVPSRDKAMIEYMDLQAVFEASRRSMLPKQYRHMDAEALNQRIRDLKLQLRI